MDDDGKSLFFLILSLSCIWLILDMFYGKKYLSKLIDGIFGTDETVTTDTKKTEIKDSNDFTKKNSTVSGATNNSSFPYKTSKDKKKEANENNKKNNSTGNSKNNGSSISFNPSTVTSNKNNHSSQGTTTGGSGTSAFPN